MQLDTLYIKVGEFVSALHTSDNNVYTFVIPVNVDTGDVINYNSHNFIQDAVIGVDGVSTLLFDLYLPGNEPANLNGAEWKALLHFE